MAYTAGQRLTAGDLNIPVVHQAESTDFTVTNTTPANGTPVCGVAFTAPPSGAVLVDVAADIQQTNTDTLIVTGVVATGSTVGSGTIVHNGNGDGGPRTLSNGANRQAASSGLRLVTGLAPGDPYNAYTQHYVSASTGTNTLRSRRITVQPVLSV